MASTSALLPGLTFGFACCGDVWSAGCRSGFWFVWAAGCCGGLDCWFWGAATTGIVASAKVRSTAVHCAANDSLIRYLRRKLPSVYTHAADPPAYCYSVLLGRMARP